MKGGFTALEGCEAACRNLFYRELDQEGTQTGQMRLAETRNYRILCEESAFTFLQATGHSTGDFSSVGYPTVKIFELDMKFGYN